MTTQDPIESTIKDRLKDLQKSTEVPTWNQVAQSLERKKRRRYVIWMWSSAGLMALLALALWSETGQPEAEQRVTTNTKAQSETFQLQEIPEVETTETASNLEENTELTETTGVETTSETPTSATKTPKTAASDFADGAEPVPTYYYYDSKTGKQMSTKDEKVIDSILKSKSSDNNLH
ncbi:hypothetical protein [Gilvibacter sediminis]|uniref:hypothetical protein n=1 Tax=Gilvibacter sediminis TaxID=379071 RepID=UPI00235032F7|nr:hypothetical protein [Gilvibacter sediminis]MDC7998632.1 hypothetical protein [Gilvibacter sediminis]